MVSQVGEREDPEVVTAALYARDAAARRHGITVEKVGAGFARLVMTVREDMVNGHDICHGGMTFFLADTALAYASNSEGRVAVATGASIVFTAPARLGDVLVAECRRVHQQGRAGLYDVTVTTREGVTVGLFRGQTLCRDQRVVRQDPPGGPPPPP
jgi:acyl-CoA thioesterase